MKKQLATISTLSLLALSLAACGGGNNNGNSSASPTASGTQPAASPTASGTASQPADDDGGIKPEAGAKLVVWSAKEQKEYLETMGKDFEAKYGVKIEWQQVGAADALNKIKKDGPAGVGADVFLLPHDNLYRAVEAGVVLPNDIYEEDTKANFPESAINALSTGDGVLYGYPRNMETYLLYYNKELVKPEDLQSWDTIKAFAKNFTNKDEKKYGVLWKLDDSYFNWAFIAGSGGYLFGKGGTDAKDIGLNNEGAVEGIKFIQSMKEVMPIKMADATSELKTELFQKKKLAINIDGIWQLGTFTKEKLGFEVGAVPFPAMPSGKLPKPAGAVQAYFVSTFSEYPNASKLFAHFLSTEEAAKKMYEMAGVLPARNGMDQDPAIASNELVKAFVEQFKNMDILPTIPETASFWTATMGNLFSPVWDKDADAKTALDKAVKDMTTLMSQAK